jgi:tRNA threonylcarbamoyladenosine biosynthesis protein TsaB
MRILAFDTCFDGCSACVAELQGGAVSVLAARFERFETGHAERLIPMIAEVMREAQLPFEGLDRIVVTTGPGTFTGTRIGVAAARAFALATGASTVAVSSLAVMAEVAWRDVGGKAKALAVVVDARRGEAYVQAFGPGGGADALTPPALLSLEDAAEAGGEGGVVFVGSGAEAAAAIAARRGRVTKALLPQLVPDAVALAHLGALLPASNVPVAPLYLRPPDAKPQDGKAVARA